MVSSRFSWPLVTSASATAPLKALDTLAMRTVSSGEMGVLVTVLPTPAVVTWVRLPTWTRAMAP